MRGGAAYVKKIFLSIQKHFLNVLDISCSGEVQCKISAALTTTTLQCPINVIETFSSSELSTEQSGLNWPITYLHFAIQTNYKDKDL